MFILGDDMIEHKVIRIVIDFINNILFHTPNEELNEQEKEMVIQNGLVHFCNSENVDNILCEGIRGDLKLPMKKIEKGYTWFYIYDEMTFDEKKQIIHGKGERKSYDAFIVVKGLSEQQMRKLRIRRKIDDAIIYPGTLQSNDMTANYINKRS